MTTTKRFHHINGFLPYKPPPWQQLNQHKYFRNTVPIIYIILALLLTHRGQQKSPITPNTPYSTTARSHPTPLVLELHLTQLITKKYESPTHLPDNRFPPSAPQLALPPPPLPTTPPTDGDAHGLSPNWKYSTKSYRFRHKKISSPPHGLIPISDPQLRV